MELIFVFNKQRSARRIAFGPWSFFACLFTLVAFCAGIFYIGSYYSLAYSSNSISVMYQKAKVIHDEEISRQHAMIAAAKLDAENNLDALAARLSKLQGHIMRLDALGDRLAKMAKLDDIVFNPRETIGMGGEDPGIQQTSLPVADFVEQLEQLSQEIDDRSDKLSAMETMLMDKSVQNKTLPEGEPVASGWISSLFGWRTDPINGKREFHEGIDFASKADTRVVAVASGIVTWSGRRAGYGNLVEISHGNGYVTRYAHNRKNLVAVGDKVDKGQPVAIMGSTGRSTGTHVHFEVVRNGKPVDPKKYISVN
jgi:murein DD-endopeptidase MepM/ murein hydrolase activator NlpD